MASELGRVIEQVEKDKSINKAILIEALESALVMAAKKNMASIKRSKLIIMKSLERSNYFSLRL